MNQLPVTRRSSAGSDLLRLGDSIVRVAGIGPKRAAALAEQGFVTVEDLLFHLPFRYEDRRRFAPLAEARAGETITVLASVVSVRLIHTRRRGFAIVQATIDDGTAVVPAVWYNQPYLARALVPGKTAFFHGAMRLPRTGPQVPRLENAQIEMVNANDAGPIHTDRIVGINANDAGTIHTDRIVGLNANDAGTIHTDRIVGVYERLGTLGSRMIRRIMHGVLARLAIDSAGRMDDMAGADFAGGEFLPEALGSIPSRLEALRAIHEPPSDLPLDQLNDFATPAHRRLILEELFVLQIGFALRRRQAKTTTRPYRYEVDATTLDRLAALSPFPLTEGQRDVLGAIVADLGSPHPMTRLLQGEVGSGKTFVAALAMALAAQSGLQSALMVPTEVLAVQHERTLRALFAACGLGDVVLLTSAVRGKERRTRLETLATGRATFAVGTHALLEEGVVFARLGLIVVDEQHRFGVMQRIGLRDKSGAVDALVMTATPIPRTLALAVHGNLDISLLSGMPPGRSPVTTRLCDESGRDALYEEIRAALASGAQVYVVHPVVDEKEGSALKAATAMARQLAAVVFSGHGVGLLHGRMSSQEKTEVLDRFRNGTTTVLVTTTVIEVGVDVPGATIVVVENAERFGLSQLHQLRGRVGRGSRPGTCVLMAGDEAGPASRMRLEAVVNESSGLRLAEIDLGVRGPGEWFGTRQAGMPELRVANIVRDAALMEAARHAAFDLVNETSAVGLSGILERLGSRWRARFRLPDSG